MCAKIAGEETVEISAFVGMRNFMRLDLQRASSKHCRLFRR